MISKRSVVMAGMLSSVFAAGCLASAPQDEASIDQTAAVDDTAQTAQTSETEQSLEATTFAQEREVTYYAEAELINIVGFCSGPFRCTGPKGLVCTGRKTAFAEVVFSDCGGP